MMENSVSINLICQNEELLIGQTIRWIKKVMNSLTVPSELVIVDGGSTDSTLDIINSEKDERFRICHNSWPGFSAQRNFAIEHSQFKWIYWTDADALACDCIFTHMNELVSVDDSVLTWAFPKFHLANNIYHIYNVGPDPLIALFRNIPEIRFKVATIGLVENFYYKDDVIFGAHVKYHWQKYCKQIWAIHFESFKPTSVLFKKYKLYASVPGNAWSGRSDEYIFNIIRTQSLPYVIPIDTAFKTISFYHELTHAIE